MTNDDTGVRQLRLVVHAEDYEGALRFFRDVLGMPEEEAYAGEGGAQVTISAPVGPRWRSRTRPRSR
jgi:catechol 2,3-dioxygenase-like lactoylglutathione lyase family enzyme